MGENESEIKLGLYFSRIIFIYLIILRVDLKIANSKISQKIKSALHSKYKTMCVILYH